MSDHVKTSEQRDEERRAGAADSAKDQALSQDSLQHVPAAAGRAEIIAIAADIQAARHSAATGPAAASSSTPDCGEPDQKQDGLPQTSETSTASPAPPQTAAEEPSSAVPAPRNQLIDGPEAAPKTKDTTKQVRDAVKTSMELIRKEPGLIVSGSSAKDLIRGLCALPTYEATARTAIEAAMAIGGDAQRAMGTDEFTTATSPDEIIQELHENSNVKVFSSVKATVEHQDRGGLALSLRESLIIEDLNPGPYRRSTRVRAQTQRLQLSETGVKCDEITAEEFSEEIRHALESSVSELSLSVLNDNSGRDSTFNEKSSSELNTTDNTGSLSTSTAFDKDRVSASSGTQSSSIYSTVAGSTAESALHLSAGSLSSVDSEAGSETSDRASTTVAEMADAVRGFLTPERHTATIVPPTSSAPPEDVTPQVPAVAGDGSATVTPEAAVSQSHTSPSAGYVDVYVTVSTDDSTGRWHCEDIPAAITLEMLKGHLYSDMACLQPYKTELLAKSSGFYLMDSPTSGRRVEPHLPLSALNKITGAGGDRIILDYQAKRFNFLSARFEETPRSHRLGRSESPSGSDGLAPTAPCVRASPASAEAQKSDQIELKPASPGQGSDDTIAITEESFTPMKAQPEPEPETMAALEVVSEGFQASTDDYDRQHALGIQLKDENQLPPVTTRTRSVSLSKHAELMVVEELSVDNKGPNAIYSTAKGSSVQPVSFTDDTAGSASPIIGHSRSTSSRTPRPTAGRLHSPVANDSDSDSDDSDIGQRSPHREKEAELVITVHPVVHNLEGNGRARAHAVMFANKTSPMTSAQATAAFNGIIKDYEPSQDIADHGETVDVQGTVWSSVVMFREPSGYVRSSYPTFSHPMPADGLSFHDSTFMTEVTEAAIQHLQLYGLSGLKLPADGSDMPSHDEVHVLRAFEDEKFLGGDSVGFIYRLHLGVSLSSKALKTLRTPYIDMDGNELALGFTPYTNLDQRTLSAYGIRSDHFWNEIIFYPEIEGDLRHLRFRCRKNASIVINNTTRSSISTSISVASHGDFDPEATKNMKPKDYTEYVRKLIEQSGSDALFTGDSDEDRTVWKALLFEVFRGPMPKGLPRFCLTDIILFTLVDGKGKEKKNPKAWMKTHLTEARDRAIRFGTDPDVSLNGGMAAEDRVDVLTKLIDALEKSFPVTNLTGAMKDGLNKLKLKRLSDLEEHYRSIHNYISKIYEAECNDPHYSKLPGYYEQHELAKFVMRHFGKISKTLGKHLEAVKTTKGYYVDPIFSEVWRVLNVNSAKDSGGVFDAIVQAKFRQIDEFVYADRTGATVKQKVPGLFKWEVTPGYWLLQVIWDFFMEPCPELKNEKSNTWYQHLHRTCTFQEGVEFLTGAGAAAGTDEKDTTRTRRRKKAGQDKANDNDKSEAQVGAMASLTESERSIVNKGTEHYNSISSRLRQELTRSQGGFRFHFLKTGEWHKECSDADKKIIKKAEGGGCCLCGSKEHNMFKLDSDKKQVCPHHHLIIKSWKRDPQVDGSKDLDDAAKKANAEVGGLEDGKAKGNGKKQPKKPQKPKELEKCTVNINALDSEGSLRDKSSGIKCAVPTYSDKMVGEVILKGDCTKFLCGLESSPGPPTQQQVAALSKERGVSLVFDPEVRLDSDEPGYKHGHFRIAKAEVFQ